MKIDHICGKERRKEGVILNSVVKKGPIVKVTFEERLEGSRNKNPRIRVTIGFEILHLF